MATCCWEWTGAKNNDGYGRFNLGAENGSKLGRPHAVSLSFGLGYMPAYVMHKCDNPCCVRPSHLKEGTHAENTKEAYAKGRQPRRHKYRGEAVKQARLSEDDVRDIRARYAGGEYQKDIAKVYGIEQTNVSHIVLRKTWKHVE